MENNDKKRCRTCDMLLPITDFPERRDKSREPDKHWIYSRHCQCAKCIAKKKAEWRKAHPGYFRDYQTTKRMKQLNTTGNGTK